MKETANMPIPVTDVTGKVFIAVALGAGQHRDVKVSISGAGTNILVLLSKEDGQHKQYLIDINTICGELAEGFHNEIT